MASDSKIRQCSISIPLKMYSKVKKLASESGLSVSAYIRTILIKHLNDE